MCNTKLYVALLGTRHSKMQAALGIMMKTVIVILVILTICHHVVWTCPWRHVCNVDVPSDDISQMSGGDEHSEHSSRCYF